MTHKAGLGDYLGNYCLAISQGKIPVIKQAEDFLPFVEDKTFPIGEYRYSNAGILLVGLAIKHAYEKKFQQPINYDEILQKYIITKVGMPSFSPWKLENGKYNLNDPVAPYIVGSPAGGYWVTAEDLAKFGRWIYKKSYTDPAFKKLIERYGQEFYNFNNQTIVHAGGIISSMAFFSVSLKTGAILSFVSNQPPTQTSDLKETILRHMFSKKISKD
jgi:CubicO group peptidase (beta-lactamase class C family)